MAVPEAQAREELGEKFGGAVKDHPEVMAECLSITRLYNLSPTDLYFKYEAFLLSRPSGLRAKLSNLTFDTARELKREIQREHQVKAALGGGSSEMTPKASVGVRKAKGPAGDLGGFLDGLTTPVRPKSKATPTSKISNGNGMSGMGASPSSSFTPATNGHAFATPSKASPIPPTASSYRPGPSKLAPPLSTPIGRSAPSSPVSAGDTPSLLTPQAAQPFHLRPQPNSLVETLNGHLPELTSNPFSARPRVSLSTTADPKDWSYRYMFEKISQRSESLDDLIDEYAEAIKNDYGITELGDPHFVSEEPIYTVGRILSPPTDNAKVNAGSLYLESSRLLGAGKRIALKFRGPGDLKVRGGAPGVKGFGVYPGCLVCVKGRNGGGNSFVVDEILLPPPSPLAQTPAEELIDYQYGERLNGEPVSMVVAAGPYTLDDDLEYAPLKALVDTVVDERPDVMVLLGPFVDSQHPLIQLGAVTSTPVDLFRDQVTSQLLRVIDSSPSTVIILVPSIRDMVSRHVAYPQAMLDKEALGLPKKIKCLPNPCTFSVNEVLISLTSVDTLFHLRREELFHKAEEAEPTPGQAPTNDAMASLVRHVLGQRTFYPIFPPPEQHAQEVNLDVTHYGLLKMEGPAPDILIIPSKLKHFSKIVDSTLVVNPAHLSRAHSAGTFAKIVVHPLPRKQLEKGMDVDGLDDDMREHAIYERARSEIWRV